TCALPIYDPGARRSRRSPPSATGHRGRTDSCSCRSHRCRLTAERTDRAQKESWLVRLCGEYFLNAVLGIVTVYCGKLNSTAPLSSTDSSPLTASSSRILPLSSWVTR